LLLASAIELIIATGTTYCKGAVKRLTYPKSIDLRDMECGGKAKRDAAFEQQNGPH
jgi:hypothetical protein